MLHHLKKISYYITFLILFFSSCVRPQLKLQQEIDQEEAALNFDSMPVPDRTKAEKLISLYLQYANDFQDDTLSPSYLFKAAELQVAIGKFSNAMELFGKVQRYPNYNKVATALFLQGFVAENHLRDTSLARKYYEKFVSTYPTHELADDARAMLTQLSLSPEALIEIFEQQNAVKDSIKAVSN